MLRGDANTDGEIYKITLSKFLLLKTNKSNLQITIIYRGCLIVMSNGYLRNLEYVSIVHQGTAMSSSGFK